MDTCNYCGFQLPITNLIINKVCDECLIDKCWQNRIKEEYQEYTYNLKNPETIIKNYKNNYDCKCIECFKSLQNKIQEILEYFPQFDQNNKED